MILYGLILLILTWPTLMVAFFPIEITKTGIEIKNVDLLEMVKLHASVFSSKRYWFLFIVMVLGQAAMLVVPVKVASRRPVQKSHLIFPIIAGSLMGAALVAGLIACVGETATQKPTFGITILISGTKEAKEPIWQSILSDSTSYIAIAEFIIMWLLWALIFLKWSKNIEPKTLIEKQFRTLYYGSILELLVAVPTHVVARYRDYCCAGFSTFIGLSLGISVMLFSFGPGVFFLYAERWKKLHPEKIKGG